MGSRPKSPEQPGLSNSQIRKIESLLSNLGDNLTATGDRQRSLLNQQAMMIRQSNRDNARYSRQSASAMRRYIKEMRTGESRRRATAIGNERAAFDTQRRIDFFNQNATNQQLSDYMKATGSANFNLSRALSMLR